MPQLSPLDDISTYQNIAQQAATRPGPGMGAPPPQAGGITPQAIMQALQAMQPPLAPPQMEGVMKIIMMITQGAEQGEMQPPPMV